MKPSFVLQIAISLSLALGPSADAQPLRRGQPVSPGEIMHHLGFVPNNVATLVRTSDIIIKGHYGRLLSHGPFWGYGETRESMEQRPNARPELVEKIARPLSEYQIDVVEVLKGPISSEGVVFHVIEYDVTDKRFTDETV